MSGTTTKRRSRANQSVVVWQRTAKLKPPLNKLVLCYWESEELDLSPRVLKFTGRIWLGPQREPYFPPSHWAVVPKPESGYED